MDENELNQTEEAAGETAEAGQDATAEARDGAGVNVVPFDLTGASGLTEGERAAMMELHGNCGDELSAQFASELGTEVAVELKEIAQTSFREFSATVPADAYMSTVAVRPLGEDIAVFLEAGLALPFVDLLLGGPGTGSEPRPLTQIEASLLESIVGLAADVLQQAWRPATDQALVFDRQIQAEEVVTLMAPSQPALLVRFHINVADSAGDMSVVLSPIVAGALMRGLSVSRRQTDRTDQTGVSERLGAHILKTPFDVKVVLPPGPVPARDLIGLRVGDVLRLPHGIDDPAMVVVGGRTMLSGTPVGYEESRAVEVLSRLGTRGELQQEETA